MLQFWGTFAVLTAIIVICEGKFAMLRDQSTARPQPYSWSRVQLAWWSVIILSSFIAILLTSKDHQVPSLDQSTLILLGISGATILTARMIDVSDAGSNLVRHQDSASQNFFLDILSDNNGASVHRFQAIVFNVAFGCWFITQTVTNIHSADINAIIPKISDQNLILLGLSSATYAAMKTTENKSNVATPPSPPAPPAPNASQSGAQGAVA